MNRISPKQSHQWLDPELYEQLREQVLRRSVVRAGMILSSPEMELQDGCRWLGRPQALAHAGVRRARTIGQRIISRIT